MTRGSTASSARIAWFEESGAQAERNRPAPALELPAPSGVVASSGRGQVTVDWQPVDGASGYLVHRADGRLRAEIERVIGFQEEGAKTFVGKEELDHNDT